MPERELKCLGGLERLDGQAIHKRSKLNELDSNDLCHPRDAASVRVVRVETSGLVWSLPSADVAQPTSAAESATTAVGPGDTGALVPTFGHTPAHSAMLRQNLQVVEGAVVAARVAGESLCGQVQVLVAVAGWCPHMGMELVVAEE